MVRKWTSKIRLHKIPQTSGYYAYLGFVLHKPRAWGYRDPGYSDKNLGQWCITSLEFDCGRGSVDWSPTVAPVLKDCTPSCRCIITSRTCWKKSLVYYFKYGHAYLFVTDLPFLSLLQTTDPSSQLSLCGRSQRLFFRHNITLQRQKQLWVFYLLSTFSMTWPIHPCSLVIRPFFY